MSELEKALATKGTRILTFRSFAELVCIYQSVEYVLEESKIEEVISNVR